MALRPKRQSDRPCKPACLINPFLISHPTSSSCRVNQGLTSVQAAAAFRKTKPFIQPLSCLTCGNKLIEFQPQSSYCVVRNIFLKPCDLSLIITSHSLSSISSTQIILQDLQSTEPSSFSECVSLLVASPPNLPTLHLLSSADVTWQNFKILSNSRTHWLCTLSVGTGWNHSPYCRHAWLSRDHRSQVRFNTSSNSSHVSVANFIFPLRQQFHTAFLFRYPIVFPLSLTDNLTTYFFEKDADENHLGFHQAVCVWTHTTCVDSFLHIT